MHSSKKQEFNWFSSFEVMRADLFQFQAEKNKEWWMNLLLVAAIIDLGFHNWLSPLITFHYDGYRNITDYVKKKKKKKKKTEPFQTLVFSNVQ